MEFLRHNYSRLEREIRGKSYEVVIGGKTEAQLLQELNSRRMEVGSLGQYTMASPDFDFSLGGKGEKMKFAQATLGELGLTGYPTTEEWQKHIRSLDYLQLCSRVAAPYLRLHDTNQKKGDAYYVAMNAITDSDGDPGVFELGRGGGALWLRSSGWADPDRRWYHDYRFVVGLRK